MRFFYADPGLRSYLGHHATSCKLITDELHRRRIDTRVLAFVKVEPRLQAELGAVPHFRCPTYWHSDGDPICGWLNAFHTGTQVTRADFDKLADIGAEDVVYVNSALPTQLMGTISWLAALPPERQPQVVIEFGVDPGVHVRTDGAPILQLRPGEPGQNAVLFRFAVKRITKSGLRPLHLATFDASSSAAYGLLLEYPVAVLPVPRLATIPIARRSGKRPITVGILGSQRPDKGYQHVPEIARELLRSRRDVRLLIHNGDSGAMTEVQKSLGGLVAADNRVTLDQRQADPALWNQLLSATDLVLCPYDEERFATSYSSVASEAIANGIPLVVPARTSLARVMGDFGGAGATFDRFTPASIALATQAALDDFDRIGALAYAGAEKWKAENGPGPLVDAILDRARS